MVVAKKKFEILANLTIRDEEFEWVRQRVYKLAGIHLVDSKKAMVVTRLSRRLVELGIHTFAEYITYLERDDDEVLHMINSITTNITRFYREERQFEVMKEKILPELLQHKRQQSQPRLRIWSAGCSSGEEVYTVLMETMVYLREHPFPALDVKVLGSDIDTTVLQKARSGLYNEEEMLGVGEERRKEFFEVNPDGLWKFRDMYRRHTVFHKINLVYDNFAFKNPIDIIYCRNVVIYFDNETKNKVYRKFHGVLGNPGYFFSGHSENLFKQKGLFRFLEKSIYEKIA